MALLGFGFAALAAGTAEAGAWPQKRGETLLILTSLIDRADQSFDADGNRTGEGYFHKDELALYGEYGLGAGFTALGRLAWQRVTLESEGVTDWAQGLAASELGLRYSAPLRDDVMGAVQLTALVPGQGENVSNQPLGDGGHAAEVRGLLGHARSDAVFLDGQLAWRWREAPNLDEARLDLTAGWRPASRWEVFVQSFSVWSVEAQRPGQAAFQQHKLQLSVARELRESTVQLGGYFSPAGRNALDERAIFVSVWNRF